ncbi:heparinase II/III family protein [Rhodovulum steppense]|uniref:Putative heparinase superfamily protein n=1 Tax=Rhodovulum steppense TaxID=540251 RepID=A0A4R1Z201_9RHOB|nr:heparinase II/III family protein [Rhodovulum steppense]TCM87627.1 putative heparinase superfamily protein [Rhodovulum steppense]
MADALKSDPPPRRRGETMNRLQARLCSLSRAAAGIALQPEPRSIGSFARGRQLCAGTFLFAGGLVEAPDTPIWDIAMPSARFAEAVHGFAWLDDLAAAGDGTARRRAQDWTLAWIDRFGRGRGPGWAPDLAGRRLIRWLHHALMLLNGLDPARSGAVFRSLAQQTRFLARRWKSADPGLPRFEALTGLVYAGLSLKGMESHLALALKALERECDREIGEGGGLASRNPEELLKVFTLLTWAGAALTAAGREPLPGHRGAIARIAPTLRALRHADGGLARFHGGGRGAEGRLDQALAEAGVKPRPVRGLAMGYARLSAGRTTVIVDAAPPPVTAGAHASTLGFELTSGRRPVIVNCGSGADLGAEWRRAGRATASHSTLAVRGFSSSRLAPGTRGGSPAPLAEIPRTVEFRAESGTTVHNLTAWHDGYGPTHGLTHVRQLMLAYDGRALSGEDTLAAFTDAERAAFDRMIGRSGGEGIAFDIRFHIHPDVDVEIDMGGAAVSLAPKSGEIWVFRHDGAAELQLVPSVYLEKGRAGPRATKQIVLSARVMDYASLITWTLAKAQDGSTAPAPRDLGQEDEAEQDWVLPWARRDRPDHEG